MSQDTETIEELDNLQKSDVDNLIRNIIDQISNPDRRLIFLCGAGVSIAAGLPGIDDLFENVKEILEKKSSKESDNGYLEELGYLSELFADSEGLNIEEIINHIRDLQRIKIINPSSLANTIRNYNFTELDKAITNAIFSSLTPSNDKWKSLHGLLCKYIRKNYISKPSRKPPEIFTTNYDLLFEKALEYSNIRYFDGFSGGLQPKFIPESVMAEASDTDNYMPRGWLRLWKMHGSINWRMKKDSNQVIRVGDSEPKTSQKCAIFPSREKVEESQLGPFGVLRDRFYSVLKKSEVVLIILGYSFRDEHLNSLIKQASAANPRLAILIFDYGTSEKSLSKPEFFKQLSNSTVIGPTSVLIGGIEYLWDNPSDMERFNEFFNEESEEDQEIECKLVDFKEFVKFLNIISQWGQNFILEDDE